MSTATKQLPARELAELPWLTLEQTAQLLQVSTEHVRRRARAGTLPGCECILGVYRVRTSKLMESAR
jgi:predicted site-specific integrase-resolvase